MEQLRKKIEAKIADYKVMARIAYAKENIDLYLRINSKVSGLYDALEIVDNLEIETAIDKIKSLPNVNNLVAGRIAEEGR